MKWLLQMVFYRDFGAVAEGNLRVNWVILINWGIDKWIMGKTGCMFVVW